MNIIFSVLFYVIWGFSLLSCILVLVINFLFKLKKPIQLLITLIRIFSFVNLSILFYGYFANWCYYWPLLIQILSFMDFVDDINISICFLDAFKINGKKENIVYRIIASVIVKTVILFTLSLPIDISGNSMDECYFMYNPEYVIYIMVVGIYVIHIVYSIFINSIIIKKILEIFGGSKNFFSFLMSVICFTGFTRIPYDIIVIISIITGYTTLNGVIIILFVLQLLVANVSYIIYHWKKNKKYEVYTVTVCVLEKEVKYPSLRRNKEIISVDSIECAGSDITMSNYL